jgi:hypothetical protein
MGNRRRRRASPLMGAVAGGVAGLAGAWMMVRFNHLIDPGTGESDKPVDPYGAPILHYAFGAAVGALYGAGAEADGSTTRGAGIPYGVAVWLIADEIGMHAAGFASKPADYPLSRHAATLATHIVFGVSVEAVRRLLRGMPARATARRPEWSAGQPPASSRSPHSRGAAR